MKQYLSKVQEIERFFDKVLITRMPREGNTRADSLVRLGSGTDGEIEASGQQVKTLNQSSITQLVNVMQVQAGKIPEWADEVSRYLKEGKLLEDIKKSQQV
jgi:hypothetical protein